MQFVLLLFATVNGLKRVNIPMCFHGKHPGNFLEPVDLLQIDMDYWVLLYPKNPNPFLE